MPKETVTSSKKGSKDTKAKTKALTEQEKDYILLAALGLPIPSTVYDTLMKIMETESHTFAYYIQQALNGLGYSLNVSSRILPNTGNISLNVTGITLQ